MLDIYVTRSNSTLCMANLNCAIYISLEWRLKLLGEGKLLEANHFLKVNGENGLRYLQAFLFLKMPFLGIFVYFKDVKLFITHIYSVEVQLHLIYFWCILFTDTFWRVVFKPF